MPPPLLEVFDDVPPEHQLKLREIGLPDFPILGDTLDEPHPDPREVVAPQYPPAQFTVVLAHRR